MTDLAEACAAIAALIPEAHALIPQPDEDGTTGTGQPDSRPPWNQAAANAYLDAHQGVRDIEDDLRWEVTGDTGPRRGGSDDNTTAAINAIASHETAVTEHTAKQAARDLARLIRAIELLQAIDTAEPWRRVQAPCPYCARLMLRVGERSGMVTCLAFGRCHDDNGQHPIGHIDKSQLTGDAGIRWNDGRFT